MYLRPLTDRIIFIKFKYRIHTWLRQGMVPLVSNVHSNALNKVLRTEIAKDIATLFYLLWSFKTSTLNSTAIASQNMAFAYEESRL
jgi:hypothetical protein